MERASEEGMWKLFFPAMGEGKNNLGFFGGGIDPEYEKGEKGMHPDGRSAKMGSLRRIHPGERPQNAIKDNTESSA